MRLLLTSDGFTNKSIASALLELTERPFGELNLAYIPTASNVELEDKGWVIEHMAKCKELGFASIDIVDISALPREDWEPRLQKADILLFEGGKTIYLMDWIKKSGLDKLLPELLKTKIYVGISAGSMVTTPNLSIAGSEILYYHETVAKNRNVKGLGLVDFLIRPHFNSKDFPMVNSKVLKDLAKDTPETIYALDDNSAIQMDGDKITVVSEGKWEKFN